MLHFRSGKCSVFVTFMSTPRSPTKTCPVRPCAVLHFPGSRVRFVIAEVHPVARNAKTCTVVLLLVFLEDMFGFHPFNFTSQLVHKAKKRAVFPLLRCAFCRTYSGFHCLNPNPRPLRSEDTSRWVTLLCCAFVFATVSSSRDDVCSFCGGRHLQPPSCSYREVMCGCSRS